MRRFGAVAWLWAALLALSGCAGHDRGVLWRIVHGACVPHEAAGAGPAPCMAVHPRAGYALLKDRDGATQVLLIPTARVTGIEDPAVLAPGAPDYLALAWDNRGVVGRLAGRAMPRQDLALAVNSIAGRTQDQLHIHIDCIRADVRDALAARVGRIDMGWRPIAAPLAGAPYLARLLDAPTLAGVNPFRLLADQVPGAAEAMGQWTLVVAGARLPPDGRPGFVLLAGHTDPATGDRGAGEQVQDHGCALARAP
ncbi:MAG: CDP-diacylglycerol diphosphatase [Rhodospirillales bacterium]|nr:CDP-diacylglycerol diphosphatase [Rhodospirillales bacterium]